MQSRILIIGGGSIGERHVRCFLATERTAVSLCEVNADVRERLAAEYPLAAVYDSLDAALAVSHDAAVVAVPAPLHVAMARRLVAAGCHVLIEKPLSTTLAGVGELKREAERRERIVGVAYVQRHNPGLERLREEVRSGRYGPPLEVVYVGGQDFARLRPAYREIYYRDRHRGGGAVQDALTHTINAVEWIVGPTRRLTADVAHLALAGVDVEDTAHVVARHDGVLASYALNQHQPPNESRLTVNCRDATWCWEPTSNRLAVMPRGEDEWQTLPYDCPDRDTGFIAQAAAFLDAIERRAAPRCTLDEAEQTLRTCLTILEAAAAGSWLDVPGIDRAEET